MLLFTDAGHVFSVVVDFDDPTVLWARSQDRESIEHAAVALGRPGDVIEEPTWDYQFRIQVSREDWAEYLRLVTMETSAVKLKPAVEAARGFEHPVYVAVEEVFYRLSHNRPDGSKPGWLTGEPRAPKRTATP